jgi:hypothetical protein
MHFRQFCSTIALQNVCVMMWREKNALRRGDVERNSGTRRRLLRVLELSCQVRGCIEDGEMLGRG